MPYPVPPAAPPPVVQVLPDKASTQSKVTPPVAAVTAPQTVSTQQVQAVAGLSEPQAMPTVEWSQRRTRVAATLPRRQRPTVSPAPFLTTDTHAAVSATALQSLEDAQPAPEPAASERSPFAPSEALEPFFSAAHAAPPQPAPAAATPSRRRPAASDGPVARLEGTTAAQRDWFPALTGLAQGRSTVGQPTNGPFTDSPGQPAGNSSDSAPPLPAPGQPLLIIPGGRQGESEETPQAAPSATPAGDTPPRTAPTVSVPTDPSGTGEPVQINADRQDYDNIRQIFIAEGRAVMRFRGAILKADRIQVNLPNRVAVAEGNVSLVRGQQEIRGDRFVYNFVQEQGNVANARGEIFLPSTDEDFSIALPTDVGAGAAVTTDPPRRRREQVSSTGGIQVGIGSRFDQLFGNSSRGGEIRRVRFEAERIDFTPDGWQATNVRLTNDPFSPPELELRSPQVTYTRLNQYQSEVRARNPRLVFDQGFSLPLFRERSVIDSRQRETFGLGNISYDDELGGFYLERPFTVLQNPQARFVLTPRLLIQRFASENDFNISDASNFGLFSRLEVAFSPYTTLRGNASLNSFDLRDFDEQFRGSLRLRQAIENHLLSLEYSYRDRLFNGSLGFQDVQSSLGLLLTSPVIRFGNSGFSLSYQGGVQVINATTDQLDLLAPVRDNNRVTLTRYQGSAALGWGTFLWRGEPLPRTPTEGMRFTPNPLVPFVSLNLGLTGVTSQYSNGDAQSSLTGSIRVRAQLGHFSRDFLDYTLVDVGYAETALDGESPFLFDRIVDRRVFSALFLQQIYGPFRAGVQTAINLDTGNEIDTAFILEYSRRTYGIVLRYNPVREVGSVTLRINDFNWGDFQEPFSEPEGSGTVEQGVRRDRD